MYQMNVTTGDTFEISTPNYPYFYPDNIACTWQFASSKNIGSYAIHFLEFHTHENDYLILGKGEGVMSPESGIRTFSAAVPSHVVVLIKEQVIWLVFQSDIFGTLTGFSLMIERIPNTGEKNKRS